MEGSRSEMTEVMRVENIDVHFNGEQILHDLSFSLYTGEMLGIIGSNGAGKSTLLKVILGLIKPQHGTVTTKKDEKKVVFGYVPQSRNIDEGTTIQAKDFVSLGLPDYFRPWLTKKDRDTVKNAMMLTDTIHLAKKPVGTLSGGERQRAFLAQSLVRNPKVLLLDESTANLDPEAQEQMITLVQRLSQEQGIGVLYISHDLDLVAKYSHRVLQLTRDHYRIGKTDEILNNSASHAQKYTNQTIELI